MRNLKRALSLALASVMLLGMMVVGTSAASYSDVSSEDNVEAIEVLNAVKVMIGKQGNFDPEAKVNRHEMATILAKLYLGSEAADNYVGTHPFTDVYPWADKYVAACYENGLISGTSKTTFGGNQPLTAVQAALMMLRALGYEDLTKGAADWRTPVAAKANEIRLFKGVVSSPNAQLTRNDVAQLALNALKSDVVVSDIEQDIIIEGVVTIPGKVTYNRMLATGSLNYNGAAADTNDRVYLQLCEKLYDNDLKLTTAIDDFGRPAIRWAYKTKEVGKYAESADVTYTAEVKAKDLYSDLSLDETTAASVTVDGKEAADFSISKSSETKIGGNGVLVEAYKNDAGKVTITVINPYVGVVSRVTPAKDDNERSVTVDGMKYETEGFEEDDVVVYTKADGVIKSMYLAETVSDVEVTRTKGDSEFVAAGETYKYAAAWSKSGKADLVDSKTDVKTENRLDLYLDSYGYVVKVDLNEGVTDYAYVVETDEDSGKLFDKGTPYAKLLLTDGTVVEAKLNYDDITFTGSYTSETDEQKLAAEFNGRIVEYSKNSKDVYKLTILKNGSDEAAKTALVSGQTITIDAGKAKMTLGAKTVYADSKTVFLIDDGDDGYSAFVGYDSVSDLNGVYNATAGDNAAYAYYCESGSVANVVYVLNATESSNDIVFLLASECGGKITNKGGDDYYECPAVVNGEIVTVKLDKSIKDEKSKVLLQSVKYANADEEIIDFDGSKAYSNDPAKDDHYITGSVTKKLTNGNLTVGGTSYRVANDAQVFVYDSEISSASRTSLAVDDTGIFVINDGQIVTIFYKEAGDGEPEPEEPEQPTDGDATKDPTGGSDIDEYAGEMNVAFVHGAAGGAQKAAEDALKAAGYTITGRDQANKKVMVTKDGIEATIVYTATEYFTVKVDNTTYYVTKGGLAKGGESELELTLNADTYKKGTGYVDGAGAYKAYAATNGKVKIKTAAMGSDTDITGNKEIKTGYVKVTTATTATGSTTTGATAGAVEDIKFAEAGKTLSVKVTLTKNTSATTGTDVTLTVTADPAITAPAAKHATTDAIKVGNVDLTFDVAVGNADISVLSAKIEDKADS